MKDEIKNAINQMKDIENQKSVLNMRHDVMAAYVAGALIKITRKRDGFPLMVSNT